MEVLRRLLVVILWVTMFFFWGTHATNVYDSGSSGVYVAVLALAYLLFGRGLQVVLDWIFAGAKKQPQSDSRNDPEF